MINWKFVVLALPLLLLVSCQDEFVPKPKGHIRIELPPHEYALADINCPFTFNLSKYATWNPRKERCWGNIEYKDYKASIQLTYKEVSNNLDTLLKDSQELVFKHTVAADGIREKLYLNRDKKVYGMLYDLKGNSASQIQFYLTDSTHHFLRGALYFYAEPNADSLRPVTDYMMKDIEYFIDHFEWKN